MSLIQFEGLGLTVQQDPTHEWTLETNLVAAGYGVTEQAITNHKHRKSDELIEGKHWVTQTVYTSGGPQSKTVWTKKGVIRLGFFIRSERAKRFRDFAEELVVRVSEQAQKPISTLTFLEMSLQAMKEQEARISSVEDNVRQLEAKITTREEFDGFYTVAAWAALCKVKVVGVAAQKAGKACAKLCRERGIMPKFLPDTKYGKIMAYPEEILKEVFETIKLPQIQSL